MEVLRGARHVWKMEGTPFASKLAAGWQRKRGVKEDSLAFDLSNWKY